jgi:SWI/SNF-related matrix-associated actin-dependent regulator of chromatin subfamily A-like protein 1
MRNLFHTLYQTTGTSKIPAVIDFLKDRLDGGEEKLIVFAHHRDVVEGISRFLQKAKYDFIRIDGQTPQRQRQPNVDRFQTTPTCRVALLSITAAGVGLTLTEGRLVRWRC